MDAGGRSVSREAQSCVRRGAGCSPASGVHLTMKDTTPWEVAFAPDCTTWITVRRDEHDEPKVGDFITVTVPKVVAIHSQPNAKNQGQLPRKGTDE